MTYFALVSILGLLLISNPVQAADPMVFAHYMLITRPPNGDYTTDITEAMNAGIDAFVINYGGWGADFNVQDGYLNDFYTAAENLNYKVFISIDCTSVQDSNKAVDLVTKYLNSPAQLYIDGKVVVSSFQTDPPSWNWQTDVVDRIGVPVLLLPGTLSDDAASAFDQSGGDGVFPWIHPTKTADEEAQTDEDYARQRDSTGKVWLAGIAPWFFKRFDANDNWSHAQDGAIFIDRWLNLLLLQPNFIEMITWNDWGESSYIGPADDTNSCPSCYWSKLDHSAFLKITAKFIKAYKARQTSVTVGDDEEDVFFFYRLQPANQLGTSDSLPLPSDAEFLTDDVFIVSFLASEADISLVSGDNTHQFTGAPGVNRVSIPFTWGDQHLYAGRNGNNFVDKQGPGISGQLDLYNGNVVAL